MLELVYGTRPDYLPRAMVRLALVERDGRRRPTWIGQSGVELLDFDRHRHYERESLERYPLLSDGTIDWAAVPGEPLFHAVEADVVEVFRNHLHGPEVVFLWGNLPVPSVKMATPDALAIMPEVVDAKPDFWIYSPGDGVLLEQTFSSAVTVARGKGGHR